MNCRGQSKRHPICRGKLLSAHQGGAGRRCYGATCLTWNRCVDLHTSCELPPGPTQATALITASVTCSDDVRIRLDVAMSVRAQARFRRQIGVLRSTVAVYIASNGGNDEEDCWVVCSFCKICQQGIVTSFREDDSGEAVLDLFAELCFERFYKAKGLFSKLFLNFLFDEETDGSHVLAHGSLSGGAKRNRRSATRGEILCRQIKGMKRDLEVWPIGRHKMFVVSSPLRRSTKGAFYCKNAQYTLPFLVQNVDYDLHNGTGLLKRKNFNEPFQLCICSRSLLSSTNGQA